MIFRMYHGTHHANLTAHKGLCLASDAVIAHDYATRSGGGRIYVIDVDFSGISEVEVDGYDRESDTAFGDFSTDATDADVVAYDDETHTGRAHTTWRLMSDRALAAITIVGSVSTDDLPYGWDESDVDELIA